MAFRGAEIVKTICLRKLLEESICDIIGKNAAYMHFVRTKEFVILKIVLDNDLSEKKHVKRIFDKADAKMLFLFREFERYRDFLKPYKMFQNI